MRLYHASQEKLMPFTHNPQERDLHDNSGAAFEDLVREMYEDDNDDRKEEED